MASSERFEAGHLHSIARRLFTAAGTPPHIADEVADHLVNANLAGHDSHGILRIPAYLKSIEQGGIKAAAEPERIDRAPSTEHRAPSTFVVDGKGGFGHYTARQAMRWGIERAKAEDVCCVSLVGTGHIGRVGEYGEMAARAGCIGITTVGGGAGNSGGTVPFGGAKGGLGTNPISVGVPTGDEAPFIIDFATSMVAEGKIQVARSKGVDLPPGCILDKHGNPTVKCEDFYDGGSLLAFGGHKGYAICLLICLLGGLSGGFDIQRGSMGGAFMQVIRIDAFTPLTEYQRGVRAFLDGIKATPPAPGFAEVLVPGDVEHRSRVQRLAHGIEVPESIAQQLRECAAKLGVSMSPDAVEPADTDRYRQAA